jgi:hypothetical protein
MARLPFLRSGSCVPLQVYPNLWVDRLAPAVHNAGVEGVFDLRLRRQSAEDPFVVGVVFGKEQFVSCWAVPGVLAEFTVRGDERVGISRHDRRAAMVSSSRTLESRPAPEPTTRKRRPSRRTRTVANRARVGRWLG